MAHITNVNEFISIFIKFPLHGFYARGEPKKYDTLFLPSIWRGGHKFDDKTPVKDKTFFTVGELESLEQCQKDVLSGKLVDEYFLSFIKNPDDPIDLENENLFHWAALAQHYNHDQCYPTRLIDISQDHLVALYFAVSSYPDKSGFVYYFKDGFNEINSNKIIKRGGTYLDVLEVSLPGDRHPFQPDDATLAVGKTLFPNKRTEAQRGAFCWTRGIELSSVLS